MSTDHELLDDVRAVLHEEVADVTAGPGLLAAVRRRRARRVTARRLGIAVTVVAAAAGVVAGVVWLPDRTETLDRADRPEPTVPPGPVNAAYVVERTSAALDGVLENVVYDRAIVTTGDKYSPPGEKALYERWFAGDGSTFRLRVTIAGKPVVDTSRDTKADVTVDYRTRTYESTPGIDPTTPEDFDIWTPKQIKQALATGKITVLGRGEPIGGKPTVKLRRHPGTLDVPMDLWVDAKTYLPVRILLLQDDSTPYDMTWLPPTPENLAKLRAVVPPGFTQQK